MGGTVLFPEVAKKLKAATGFDIAPYGNFSRDRTKWETYPATPRYGVQYFALRGAIGVLSESYSYASFQDRVKATHAFVTACFEVAATKRKDLERAVSAPRIVPLRTLTEPFTTKIGILGFEEIEKDGKRVATEKPKEYTLKYVGHVVPTETTTRPFAYLIPPQYQRRLKHSSAMASRSRNCARISILNTEAFAITAVEASEGGLSKAVHHDRSGREMGARDTPHSGRDTGGEMR